ncbi:MAG: CBS domain-containing protein [Crocinitomicaceae bacterium]|nr:CBS domain-containing protein [Crocinitomicaceae bacterium]
MNLNAPISSIMTKDVECVNPEQKILDVKHIYEKRDFHHHIPVVEDGFLVGMVSLIDFMRKIQDATLDDNESVYHDLTVRDIMFGNPSAVSSDTTIKLVAEELALGNVHALVVADDKVVKGIVSTADIISFFLNPK